MLKTFLLRFFIITIFMFSLSSFALQAPSPVGLWKTYDLNHNARGLVKFSIVHGSLIGSIVNDFPSSSSNPVCSVCKGALHNKPLIGMTIIWGLIPKANKWENGYVLDIDSGNIYRCKISISADNKILHFSPYMGIPLFGPTIDWVREG